MSKNAKRILIILSSILIALIVAFIIPTVHFYITWLSAFSTTNYFVEDFEKYKNDYIAICEKVVDLSKTNDWTFDEERYYFIDIVTNYDNRQSCFISYEYKYPYTNYPEYKLSDEIAQNYKNIYDSFPSEHGYEFDFICYRKNRISFHSENGHYAVVYSFDDKKPTFWFTPSEEDDIKVKKITKNWYHMWR